MQTQDVDRPRDYDAVEVVPDPAPPPPKPALPEVRRVSYADHATEAAARHVEDNPDEAGRLASEATHLRPLQAIQVAFDQLANVADDRRRGLPWEHSGIGYAKHTRDVIEHTERHARVLRVAADAADAMIGSMKGQLDALETAMSQARPDDAPQLTTTGEPHPLQEGGYEPDADPQLPGNISDVEALKEGKTTRAENEAIARADAAGDEGQEPTPSEDAMDAVLGDEDDDDEPKGKPKAKGKKGGK